MSVGPLRRITATVGLVGLSPIAVMLVVGALTPEQAALRAVAVAVVAVLLGRLARVVLKTLLRRVERRSTDRSETRVDESPAAVQRESVTVR